MSAQCLDTSTPASGVASSAAGDDQAAEKKNPQGRRKRIRDPDVNPSRIIETKRKSKSRARNDDDEEYVPLLIQKQKIRQKAERQKHRRQTRPSEMKQPSAPRRETCYATFRVMHESKVVMPKYVPKKCSVNDFLQRVAKRVQPLGLKVPTQVASPKRRRQGRMDKEVDKENVFPQRNNVPNTDDPDYDGEEEESVDEEEESEVESAAENYENEDQEEGLDREAKGNIPVEEDENEDRKEDLDPEAKGNNPVEKDENKDRKEDLDPEGKGNNPVEKDANEDQKEDLDPEAKGNKSVEIEERDYSEATSESPISKNHVELAELVPQLTPPPSPLPNTQPVSPTLSPLVGGSDISESVVTSPSPPDGANSASLSEAKHFIADEAEEEAAGDKQADTAARIEDSDEKNVHKEDSSDSSASDEESDAENEAADSVAKTHINWQLEQEELEIQQILNKFGGSWANRFREQEEDDDTPARLRKRHREDEEVWSFNQPEEMPAWDWGHDAEDMVPERDSQLIRTFSLGTIDVMASQDSQSILMDECSQEVLRRTHKTNVVVPVPDKPVQPSRLLHESSQEAPFGGFLGRGPSFRVLRRNGAPLANERSTTPRPSVFRSGSTPLPDVPEHESSQKAVIPNVAKKVRRTPSATLLRALSQNRFRA